MDSARVVDPMERALTHSVPEAQPDTPPLSGVNCPGIPGGLFS